MNDKPRISATFMLVSEMGVPWKEANEKAESLFKELSLEGVPHIRLLQQEDSKYIFGVWKVEVQK